MDLRTSRVFFDHILGSVINVLNYNLNSVLVVKVTRCDVGSAKVISARAIWRSRWLFC